MGKPKKETKRQMKTPEEKRKGRDKGWKEKVKVSKTAAKAAIKKREKTFRVSKPGVEAMQKVTTNYMKEIGHTTKELAKHRDSKTADQYDVHFATQITPKSFYESDRELSKRPEKGKMRPKKVKEPKLEKIKKEKGKQKPLKDRIDTLSLKEKTKRGSISIKDMEKVGNRWKKGDIDRIYFNVTPDLIGLDYETYNTGNIFRASRYGNSISNNVASKLRSEISMAKIYYDVNDQKYYGTRIDEDIWNEVMPKIRKQIKEEKRKRNKRDQKIKEKEKLN